MNMGINLNAVQKVLAFHFSEKVENGRGVSSATFTWLKSHETRFVKLDVQ